MALVTTPGASNADSYASVAEADTYFTNYGNPTNWAAASTANKELWLRQATRYMEQIYGTRFIGLKATQEAALEWPRSGAVTHNGFLLADDEIPTKIVNATIILAGKASDGDTLLPDITEPSSIKRTKDVVDVIETEVEYFWKGEYKAYSQVEAEVDGLLKSGVVRS